MTPWSPAEAPTPLEMLWPDGIPLSLTSGGNATPGDGAVPVVIIAAVFASMVAWWNLGLPRVVFSPEAPTDARIATTWNNMSGPGAFALAGAEEQEGGDGEPPPVAGAGVVVCLMG